MNTPIQRVDTFQYYQLFLIITQVLIEHELQLIGYNKRSYDNGNGYSKLGNDHDIPEMTGTLSSQKIDLYAFNRPESGEKHGRI